MEEKVIPIKLELITGGESIDDSNKSEDKKFKIEDLLIKRMLISKLRSILPAGAATGVGIAAILGTAVIIPGSENPKAREYEKNAVNVIRNKRATEELNEAAMSFDGGLMTMEDGSIELVDEFGNTIRVFGVGGDVIYTGSETINNVLNDVNKFATAVGNKIVSAVKFIQKEMASLELRRKKNAEKEKELKDKEKELDEKERELKK